VKHWCPESIEAMGISGPPTGARGSKFLRNARI
jgi:hypothetical protein